MAISYNKLWKLLIDKKMSVQPVPLVQPRPQVLKKRCILSLIWVADAAVVAALVVLLF